MSSARRIVALGIFGLFLLTLLLRPITRLVSAGFSGDELDASVFVLSLPGVVVLLVMLLVAVVVLGRTGDDSDVSVGQVLTMSKSPERETTPDERSAEERGDTRDTEVVSAEDSATERRDDDERTQVSFLSGQGGTRNKGFEIEEEPPETDVDEHMQYLREQLGEEEFDSAVDDVRRLEDVESNDRETDEPGRVTGTQSTLPEECPQPYCDARWGRGRLFGARGGRYELVDGGEQVQCEECGGITTLE